MDILDLIKKEHRKVEALFSEIESTEDTQKLYEGFNQLYEEISLYVEVKEQVFYPAIRKHCEDTEELVGEAQKEHDQVKQLLEEMESLSPTSKEFQAKIRELKQVIQHYTKEEENQVFLRVRESMSNETRIRLGSEFEQVKKKLQSEMSIFS